MYGVCMCDRQTVHRGFGYCRLKMNGNDENSGNLESNGDQNADEDTDQDIKAKSQVSRPGRFSQVCRAVRLMLKVCRGMVKYAQSGILDYDSIKLNIAPHDEGLAFDKDRYRRRKEFRWPPVYLEIARKSTASRTPSDIRALQKMMRCLRSFRKFNSETQMEICRYAKYERYTRNRVIIRRGHKPQGVYFLFSGTVTEAFSEPTEGAARHPEIRLYRRGDLFGIVDIALKQPRSTTFICDDLTEVLYLDLNEIKNAKLTDALAWETISITHLFRKRSDVSSLTDEAIDRLVSASYPVTFDDQTIVDVWSRQPQWVYVVYKSGIFHLHDSGQYCGGKKPGRALRKPTTILRLLANISCATRDEASVSWALTHNDRIRERHLGHGSCDVVKRCSVNELPEKLNLNLTRLLEASDTGNWSGSLKTLSQKEDAELTDRQKLLRFLDTVDNNISSRVNCCWSRQRPKSSSTEDELESFELGEDSHAPPSGYTEDSSPRSQSHGSSNKRMGSGSFSPSSSGKSTPDHNNRVLKSHSDLNFTLRHLEPGSVFGGFFLSRENRDIFFLSKGCTLVAIPASVFAMASSHDLTASIRDSLSVAPSIEDLCSKYAKLLVWGYFKNSFIDSIQSDSHENVSLSRHRGRSLKGYYLRNVTVPSAIKNAHSRRMGYTPEIRKVSTRTVSTKGENSFVSNRPHTVATVLGVSHRGGYCVKSAPPCHRTKSKLLTTAPRPRVRYTSTTMCQMRQSLTGVRHVLQLLPDRI